ncbi:isoamyl alcohol oxidase [Diplocarpon rosae]|nr:isoamyl alcohol oxidase [Diplocarpon rosae]
MPLIRTAAVLIAGLIHLSSSTPIETYGALASMGKRGPNTTTLSNAVVLAPVSRSDFAVSALAALERLPKRDAEEMSSLTPQTDIVLYYQSSGTSLGAEVKVRMQFPSVLLEEISSVSSVTCTVSEATADLDIAFVTPPRAVSKRDLSRSFSAEFPGRARLANGTILLGDTRDKLAVTASDTTASGSFSIRGRVSYSFWKVKFTTFYFELDVSAAAATSLDLNLSVTYDAPVLSYAPLELSITAFEIAGIFSIGPGLAFELGVELIAEGDVGLTTDLAATLRNGFAHLDLLHNTSTYTSGWSLEFSHQVNTTTATQLQVDPYVSLKALIRAELLGAYTSLEASITAKPENLIDIDAPANRSTRTNTTHPHDTSSWYASSFVFHVTAHVAGLFSTKLYELPLPEIPTLVSDFWSMEYFGG